MPVQEIIIGASFQEVHVRNAQGHFFGQISVGLEFEVLEHPQSAAGFLQKLIAKDHGVPPIFPAKVNMGYRFLETDPAPSVTSWLST